MATKNLKPCSAVKVKFSPSNIISADMINSVCEEQIEAMIMRGLVMSP